MLLLCFLLIEVGHMLFGLEKVDLILESLNHRKKNQLTVEERKEKRWETDIQTQDFYKECYVLFLLLTFQNIQMSNIS